MQDIDDLLNKLLHIEKQLEQLSSEYFDLPEKYDEQDFPEQSQLAGKNAYSHTSIMECDF